MTDQDGFDRELTERLRAHEQRVPGGDAPRLTDELARQRWAPLALVGAAGLVAGVVLVGVLLQRPAPPSGEASPTPASSTAVDSAAPTATASPQVTSASGSSTQSPGASTKTTSEGLHWTTTASFAARGGQAFVEDMVDAGDSIVAVGVAYNDPLPEFGYSPPHSARVWLSRDGRRWEQLDLGGGLRDVELTHVIRRADGSLLAFGSRSAPNDFGQLENAGPIALASLDGRSWHETPTGLEGVVREIVQGPMGYLALTEVLWWSADGVVWEEIGAVAHYGRIHEIAAGTEGFVITGTSNPDTSSAFVLASGDGRSWYEASEGNLPGAGGQFIAPLGGEWILLPRVVYGEGHIARTWFSSNGLEWMEHGSFQLLELSAPGGQCVEDPTRLVSSAEWLIASTTLSFPCSEGGFVVYGRAQISLGGADWSVLPFDTGTIGQSHSGPAVHAAIVFGGNLILAGEQDGAATFWLGEP